MMFGDGFFVHTFSRLVPPEKYFKDHPEYFSLVNGKRQNGYAQLCCTNPDVIRICTEEIRKAMRAQPQATVFSVSQNDCDKHCRLSRAARRWPAGRLADGAGAATGQSRGRGGGEGVSRQDRGDAGLRVDPPAAEAHAAAAERGDPAVLDRVLFLASAGHVQQLVQPGVSRATWRAGPRWPRGSGCGTTPPISPTTCCRFPISGCIGPNIRYFVAHNVKGIFEEDVGDTPDSELASLGGYVMAKCLWNPEYDANRAIERVSGRLLRPGGPADPRVHRPAARLRRTTSTFTCGIFAGSTAGT